MQARKLSLVPRAKSLEDLNQKANSFVASAKSPATLKAYRNDTSASNGHVYGSVSIDGEVDLSQPIEVDIDR